MITATTWFAPVSNSAAGPAAPASEIDGLPLLVSCFSLRNRNQCAACWPIRGRSMNRRPARLCCPNC